MDVNFAYLLDSIPTLSTLNFAEWHARLSEVARFLGWHRVLLGYEKEPYRCSVEVGHPDYSLFHPPGTLAGDHLPNIEQRMERGGDILPYPLSLEQEAKWEKWAAQEGKARWLVLQRLEGYHYESVRNLWCAHDMITHLARKFTKPIKGPHVREDTALAKLKLPESPTTKQMRAHLHAFSAEVIQATNTNQAISLEEGTQTFVFTLSQPLAFHMDTLRRNLSEEEEGRGSWKLMKAEFLRFARDPSRLSTAAVALS